MSRAWARMATLLGALFLACCLSGCEVRGTVDVLSAEDVAVDVTITGLSRGACSSNTSGMSEVEVQRGIDTSGQRFCRVRGVAKVEELSGLTIASAAEYYVFTVEFDGVSTSWPVSDLTVRFPGQVVDASMGTVSGSSVHLDDLSTLAGGEPLQVVALQRPGPPGWLVAAGFGVLGGAVIAFILQRWLANRRPAPEAAPDDEVPDGDALDAELEPSTVEFDPLFFAPVRPGPDPVSWPEPAAPVATPGPEVWAAPAEADRPEEPTARRGPESDHSVWGPPA